MLARHISETCPLVLRLRLVTHFKPAFSGDSSSNSSHLLNPPLFSRVTACGRDLRGPHAPGPLLHSPRDELGGVNFKGRGSRVSGFKLHDGASSFVLLLTAYPQSSMMSIFRRVWTCTLPKAIFRQLPSFPTLKPEAETQCIRHAPSFCADFDFSRHVNLSALDLASRRARREGFCLARQR